MPRSDQNPVTAEECLRKAAQLLTEGEAAANREALHYGNANGADRARRARELAGGWCRLAEAVSQVRNQEGKEDGNPDSDSGRAR